MPIDPRMVKWEEAPSAPSQIDPRMVKWDDTKDFNLKGEAFDRMANYSGRDAVGGAIRGAGSIGATVIRPFESAQENAQRRTDMDQALATLGADPESMSFKTNKLLTEIAGTSGVGGGIAKTLFMIPGASVALPTLLPAIQSGGMAANGTTGAYGMASRMAGGAVNGGAMAGLVNPEDSKLGAIIGGAFPPVVKLAGMVGGALGRALHPQPISPVLQQTAKESVEAGYVIPPNMVSPSFPARVLESVSGKQATSQIASTRNTQNTERIVREALSIPADMPMNRGTLETLRKTAGKAYGEVSSLSPQAAADLEALKQARNDAQTWFNAYNRSASPEALEKAKAFRETADNLENWLEFHAASAGKNDLIDSLRKARKEIAKTYTVERALNDASGTVDARVIGRLHEKGKPLSDGLEKVGKFASAFPSAAKSPQQVGSPAAHNLATWIGAGMGGAGAASGAAAGLGALGTGGLGAAAFAVPFVAPAAARSIMFSGPMQRRLASARTPGLLSQSIDEALPLLYRTNPLLATYAP